MIHSTFRTISFSFHVPLSFCPQTDVWMLASGNALLLQVDKNSISVSQSHFYKKHRKDIHDYTMFVQWITKMYKTADTTQVHMKISITGSMRRNQYISTGCFSPITVLSCKSGLSDPGTNHILFREVFTARCFFPAIRKFASKWTEDFVLTQLPDD